MKGGLGLAPAQYFDYSRIMETTRAVDALAALAQRSRLEIYRLLVEAGPQGMPAGAVGEKLGVPAATLSFHLAHLVRAGIAKSRQDGRFVYYSADFRAMRDLVGFLTENCCKGARNETPARARRCA